MERVQKTLMAAVVAAIFMSAVMVVLFETDILPCGILKGIDASQEFVLLMVMELLTLCIIPVALRLMKFGIVAKSMNSPKALLRWGGLRIAMLCVPMVANTLLYYLYMNVAFGYMGIILLLCLAFVLPTKARCYAEINTCDDSQVNDK